MAKIKKLPSQAIVDGFKGTIDFYLWKGIPCVRKWPRSPGHFRTTAVMAQWPTWTYVSKIWNSLSPTVRDAYIALSAGTHMSGRDLFTKSYLSSLYIRLE